MKRKLFIAAGSALAVLTGAAQAEVQAQPFVINGVAVEATLNADEASKAFSVAVTPKSAAREIALSAGTSLAGQHCKTAHHSAKLWVSKVKKKGWATPGHWEIEGRCE